MAVSGYNEATQEAAHWDDVVLACRLRGHSWEQYNSKKEGRQYEVYFECTRKCGCHKTERWDNRGRVLRKHMTYPKDGEGNPLYLSTIGRFDAEMRGALRMATLDRRGER